ncbi:hypothetical protein [Alsobacter sp. R-9]
MAVDESKLSIKSQAESSTNDESPELALWCAVIRQAVSDAVDSVASDSVSAAARQKARVWFVRKGKDFREVCTLAGVDPDQVHAAMTKRIADADGITIEEALARYNPRPEHKRLNVDFNAPAPEHKRGPHGRTITYAGRTLTVSQWAAVTGLNRKTIAERLDAGLSLDEVFSERIIRGEPYTFNGRTLTANQWAAELGISERIIRHRIANNLPLDMPLGKGGNHRAPIELTHDGRTQSVVVWADELGISATTIYERLRKGWPIELVLSPKDQRLNNGAPRTVGAEAEPALALTVQTIETEPEPIKRPGLLSRARGWVATFLKAAGTGAGSVARD